MQSIREIMFPAGIDLSAKIRGNITISPTFKINLFLKAEISQILVKIDHLRERYFSLSLSIYLSRPMTSF